MKFSKLSQLFLVSSTGLLVAALLTACQIITIDYVFVAGNSGIETYAADSETGALRSAAATVTSGVNGPVAMATTSDYAHLYLANKGNKTVVHYAISSNGVVTVADTVTLTTTPVALAVNASNTYLYVVSGTASATLTEYPLASGVIGAASATPLTIPGFATDTLVPTGVNVLINNNSALSATNAIYVSAYDLSAYNPGGTTSSTANPGWIFGYSVGSGGALSQISGSPWKAGIKPTALVSNPTNRFVYAIDFASNQMIGYGITGTGTLNYLLNGPFKTGNEPTAIAIDPRGTFLYVTNALDSTVSAYSIDLTTGTPSGSINATGSSLNATDTDPVALAVDPALGRYVYTANYLGNSISGFRLDPTAGTLAANLATPYPTGQNPTAVAIVPHGNHAIQSVTP